MTTRCPNGHESQDPEWCDTCGARLGAVPSPTVTATVAATPTATAAATPAPVPEAAVDCPHCGTPNEPGALFCEGCGYDFTTGQAPPTTEEAAPPDDAATGTVEAPPGWIVVVEVDKEWFELKGQLAQAPFPGPTSSTIALGSATALIGRTSRSRQLFPEIALDGDTGVSRRHAQLVHSVDGAWTVVDLGSSNGTCVLPAGQTLGADIEPIAVGIPQPIGDHDAIYLGAWTKLTLRNSGA